MHTEATMERIRTSVLALLFTLAIRLPVSAQQHVADQATLDQVVADHVRQKADDREAIRRVLEIEQVREVAEGAGLDLKRAQTAVVALDDAEVGLIAAQARAVNDALAGGQSTVTISTTVIIIGLLVLILLIVAI
jgi:acetyl-CoA carboxylase carboxyltransferase component